MVNLRRITSAEDKDFKKLAELYIEAFPPEERRDISQLERLLKSQSEMFYNAVECDGKLAGLFSFWNFGDFWYLEHLAVYADMRNHKIGQQILDFAKEHLTGIRLLEVEPDDHEMAVRRINYYQRNGYKILEKDYVQPSYDGMRSALPLWIMGNEEYDDPALLQKHIEIIKEKVYYGPRGAKAGDEK